VTFLTGETVTAIEPAAPLSVATRSAGVVPCDFVCVAVGVIPNVEIAQDSGLEVENGIVVDEYLQTSNPVVYAAGDVANYPDPIFGRRRRVEHWGHAEYTGQIAGHNMAGGRSRYDLLNYVWSDIFDLHLEFAGDESQHDRVLIRGRLEDHAFTVLYLKEDALRAYFAINADSHELPPLQDLIRSGRRLTGTDSRLADTRVAIDALV
jgi:3-phenylpropionate/trans-cinnamate dioxygenase ferredoxin reductase subunit